MNARLRALAVLLTVVAIVPADAPARTTSSPTLGPARTGAVVKELRFGETRLLVSFVPSEFRLSEQDILDWVLRSARATATYFGRFPGGRGAHIPRDRSAAHTSATASPGHRRTRASASPSGATSRHAPSRATARWCTR